MKNSGVPSGGARFLSVITPARQVGVAILLNSGFKGKTVETLSSGMGRWIISIVHFESKFIFL